MPAKSKPSKRKLGWIAFLKKYAKDHKMDYGDAMASKRARDEYHKQK